jgi:TolB-like protein
MTASGNITKIGLVLFFALFPASVSASLPLQAPVAVFPLQELGRGSNDVNLPFTSALAERLAASGNEITGHDTVISFMAHNRIRTVGYLESFHIARAREELGAAFVLLGTISQAKEQPVPSMGVSLQLVRTSDARIMWSHVGHLSAADARRLLGIGEPKSVAELQPLILDDIVARWPWEIISEMQKSASISIDSILLQPRHVRPGSEVYARVNLRDQWPAGRAPRIFFQADDQIHAATVSADGSGYEATWVAGERDGRFPVSLLLQWPLYGRNETAMLGAYVVDGTPPLFELELRGAHQHDDVPVFRKEVVIMPRVLVRKPLARWRLSFVNDLGHPVGVDEGSGNLPENFIWRGDGNKDIPVTNGVYKIILEAWDPAGNSGSASRLVDLDRSKPEVELAVARNGREMLVDLEHRGKVPLAFWSLEMWTREGRIIKAAEGRELPARLGIELPAAEEEGEIEGFLLVQDILGNSSRQKVEDIFLLARKQEPEKVKEEKPAGISETWVDEF